MREASRTVFVVEGEKDCDAAIGLGVVAVCNPEGASSSARRPKWMQKYTDQLRDLPVVIVADKDEPGRAHGAAVAGSLHSVAASVRLVEVPGDHCKDLSDWIAAEKSEGAKAADLVRKLERWSKDEAIFDPKKDQAKPDPKAQKFASTSSDKSPPPQIEIFIELTSELELFHTREGVAYVSVPKDRHLENWQIVSDEFKRWLTWRFYHHQQRPPHAQALQEIQSLLEARACFEGPELPVFRRVAEHEGRLFLDLGNEAWECVEVTADGWKLNPSPPVKFLRSRGMQPLPKPERGGDLHELLRLLNLAEEDGILVLAWLLAALRSKGPFPILVLQGEQGSAKSTTARILRSLIDPSVAPIRTLPGEERDLMIAAHSSWMLAFDNLSGLPAWLADAFCRLATGGGFSTRALYTDRDEVLLEAQQPVMLNGIDDLTGRHDLADRALAIHLPPIPETARRTEREIWDEVETLRPKLLGALLDAASLGLRRLPETRLSSAPRMADFAQWIVAAEPSLPGADGRFLEIFARNRNESVERAVENDPVAAAVRELIETREVWEGTATELLGDLAAHVPEPTQRSRSWPTTARAMSGRIRRSSPALRVMGIQVRHYRETGGGSRRLLKIWRSEPQEEAQDQEVSHG